MNKRIKVIYILGAGHSGSTLLDLLLGSHSQVESVGEINNFYDYISPKTDHLKGIRYCTCGTHVDECPYWKPIRENLRSEFGTDEISLQPNDPKAFASHNQLVFQSILDVSGKSVICDSSKIYSRLQGLLNANGFDVEIIHLIRDSRAVAYSYKKKGEKFYPTLIAWLKVNLYEWFKLRKRKNYRLLRYEDFVDNPEAALKEILKSAGLNFESEQLLFWKHEHHNLGGNRMRNKGRQEIRKDTKYVQALTATEWWACTLLSLPGLMLFRYPLRKK